MHAMGTGDDRTEATCGARAGNDKQQRASVSSCVPKNDFGTNGRFIFWHLRHLARGALIPDHPATRHSWTTMRGRRRAQEYDGGKSHSGVTHTHVTLGAWGASPPLSSLCATPPAAAADGVKRCRASRQRGTHNQSSGVSRPGKGCPPSDGRQGLTLVHFSAQLEPYLNPKHTLDAPSHPLSPPKHPLHYP
jgi:hypothetical protein